MRIYLLPISTRRSLIYCRRLNVALSDKPSPLDKITNKAATIWAGWEQQDRGWKKKVVDFGNVAMKRIPFEEWGLKSVPPLGERKDKKEGRELSKEEEAVEVHFPSIIIPESNALEELKRIGTERVGLHKQRLVWCVVGMPISAPLAVIPVVPNLPFFYLLYRAWSHYRALAGSKHIQYLLQHNLFAPNPSPTLDLLYSSGIMKSMRGTVTLDPKSAETESGDKIPLLDDAALAPEVLLLGEGDSKRISEVLDMPELHAELDRAIWQVKRDLHGEALLKEKDEWERARMEEVMAKKAKEEANK